MSSYADSAAEMQETLSVVLNMTEEAESSSGADYSVEVVTETEEESEESQSEDVTEASQETEAETNAAAESEAENDSEEESEAGGENESVSESESVEESETANETEAETETESESEESLEDNSESESAGKTESGSGNESAVENESAAESESAANTENSGTSEGEKASDSDAVKKVCSECGKINGHAEDCSLYECSECGGIGEHEETCSKYVAEENPIMTRLLAAESVEEMYMIVLELMNEAPEELLALTEDEIAELCARIWELDPEGDDADTQDLLDTLAILPNGGEVLFGNPKTLVPNGFTAFNSTGGTLSTGKYALTTNTNLTSKLEIKGDVVLDLCGYVLQGNGTNDVMIEVPSDNTLTIVDSNPTLGHNGNINSEGIWKWENGNYNSKSLGGIIYNRGTGKGIGIGGTCTMEGGMIAGCYSTDIGAAVTVTSSGTFIMTGGKIIYNYSASQTSEGERGGAIYGEPSHNNNGSKIEISNAEIIGNTSVGNGGAICGYNVELNNCLISENKTNENGGGVYIRHTDDSKANGTLIITDCTLDKNTAAKSGGGIYGSADSRIEITGDTCISNNAASNAGGGIYAADLKITGEKNNYVSIYRNSATVSGGGIYANQNCDLDYCSIDGNYSGRFGGGIYTFCDTEITNSNITKNLSMTTEPNDGTSSTTRKDWGRGGGFYFDGSASKRSTCTLEKVNVTENACMYYGGGGQVCNYARLELKSGCINNNEAVLHGAGGLHVTASATFTLTDGEIAENIGHTVGGGIHSSYSCQLNLNGGVIRDNIVYGRGGGVHVNVGGNLVLNGTDITGNKAYDGVNRLGAVVTKNDNGWTWEVKTIGAAPADSGYGGGVLIDSGTCTMKDGEVSGNWAKTGGGGIAFIMKNIGTKEHFGENKVVSFDLVNGEVSNNSTDGNGAGIYLMQNKLSGELTTFMKDTGYTFDSDKNVVETVEVKDADGNVIETKVKIKLSASQVKEYQNGKPYINITGGTIKENDAVGNGGGAYQEINTEFFISGSGDVSNNTAVNGAGVYIAQGYAEINGGTITSNDASANGGALYITGNVKMTNGSITENTAQNFGGALYVADGNILMEHGLINENSAVRGGAVYMAGNSDTTLTMESGQMNGNSASDDGGAIYATNGILYIGLKDCDGTLKDDAGNVTDENNDDHEAKANGRYHPQIQNNTAEDCGGGIAIENKGIVHFYCGSATQNEALYKGVGKNVFMVGGQFFYYDGADVGVPRDPDLVIIGGELWDKCEKTDHITLKYYNSNETDGENEFTGLAEIDAYMNLPEGEYFWNAETGYRFVGWTPYGPDSDMAKTVVRDKDDYKPSGTPVQITDTADKGGAQGTYDNEEDKTMHLYAVWAPEVSTITYADSLTFGTKTFEADVVASESTSTTNPNKYTIYEQKYDNITISSSELGLNHPGYEIVGWYLYQDEGKNANWSELVNGVYKSYEPIYVEGKNSEYTGKYDVLDYTAKGFPEGMKYLYVNADGNVSLPVEAMTFGDITLVADYELLYSDLTITKTGASTIDEDQTFIFNIEVDSLTAETDTINNQTKLAELTAVKNYFKELPTVMVQGNGSVKINHLPLGSYTVTEDESWSWRYSADSVTTTLNVGGGSVTIENTRDDTKWLDGSTWCKNIFDDLSTSENETQKLPLVNSILNLVAIQPDERKIRF